MLTEARARTPWLREGSSVVQQQVIRDFGRSRAKAHKDITERLPMARRAGMPKWKSKRGAPPSLNYTKRGFRLKDGRLHLAGGIVVAVVWSRELPAEPSSVRVYQDSLGHWYGSFVVPAQVQPLPETGRALGVDWGVKETATTIRRARPAARRARQEGTGEADAVRQDDGPPQAEEGPARIEGLPRGEESAGEGEGVQEGRETA
nr:transposase [Kutzneria buriramensis]WKX08580.1 transposase [Kutzneria buriramensis]